VGPIASTVWREVVLAGVVSGLISGGVVALATRAADGAHPAGERRSAKAADADDAPPDRGAPFAVTCPPSQPRSLDSREVDAIAARVVEQLASRDGAGRAAAPDAAAAPQDPPDEAAIARAEAAVTRAIARGRWGRADAEELRAALDEGHSPEDALRIRKEVAAAMNAGKLAVDEPTPPL
jgi:hypothetical protein